ncbi:MAG: hypothetical protein WA419_01250, partial [Silvibacterium sp.]
PVAGFAVTDFVALLPKSDFFVIAIATSLNFRFRFVLLCKSLMHPGCQTSAALHNLCNSLHWIGSPHPEVFLSDPVFLQ